MSKIKEIDVFMNFLSSNKNFNQLFNNNDNIGYYYAPYNFGEYNKCIRIYRYVENKKRPKSIPFIFFIIHKKHEKYEIKYLFKRGEEVKSEIYGTKTYSFFVDRLKEIVNEMLKLKDE